MSLPFRYRSRDLTNLPNPFNILSMNLWLPIIVVIGLHNGAPVKYSYPLSSSLHYNEENCEAAAIAGLNDFALALSEAGVDSLSIAAYCIVQKDQAQI